jgi:hypothetical protein
VLAGEQQGRAFTREVGLERRGIAVELGLEVRISTLVEELQRGFEIADAREESLPRLDLGPEAIRLAQDTLRGALVIPEA